MVNMLLFPLLEFFHQGIVFLGLFRSEQGPDFFVGVFSGGLNLEYPVATGARGFLMDFDDDLVLLENQRFDFGRLTPIDVSILHRALQRTGEAE